MFHSILLNISLVWISSYSGDNSVMSSEFQKEIGVINRYLASTGSVYLLKHA